MAQSKVSFSSWSNRLTLLRLLLAPVTILCYYLLQPFGPWAGYLACLFFVIAAITDALDGWLARLLQTQSQFGALLDQVVDKIIVVSVLIVLVSDQRILDSTSVESLFIVAVMVIICREVVVPSLREWIASTGRDQLLTVRFHGKIKTTAQMTALALLLYKEPVLGIPIFRVGELLLYFAALMTLLSMLLYVRSSLADT